MPKTNPFQNILELLRDETKPLTAPQLARFSDLTPEQLKLLNKTWPEIPAARKRGLLKQIVEKYADDFLVSYDDFAAAVMHDADAEVRVDAVRLLVESDDPEVATALMNMLQTDPDESVRVEAANTLGSFVYLGELDELDEDLLKEIEDALLATLDNESSQPVRRKALEAVGFSARPDVIALIEASFSHRDPHWVASALIAMGRSGLIRWEDAILASLTHENKQVHLAAMGAAGEFGIADARPILLRQLDEGEDDEEIFRAIIWTLSKIGGEDVRTYLENLLDSEDDDLVAFVEEALENLDLTEELNKFNLLAFDPDLDLENFLELPDLDDEEAEKPETDKKPARKKHKKSGN